MSQQRFEPGSHYVASQPQPTEVPMAQPQPGQVILTTSPVNMQPTKSNHQKTLRHLGLAEALLGVLIVVIGVLVALYEYISNFRYRLFTTGEGIWCGIWIIVSGTLGIVLGKRNPTRCWVNTRMAFGIVGSVFATIGFLISIVGALSAGLYSSTGVGLFSCMTIAFFASMVLMIMSSTFCCAISGCCCHSYSPAVVPGAFPGQVVYTHQQITYPVTQSVYPGYAPQTYQQMHPGQQMQPMHLSQQMQPMHPAQQMQSMQPMQPISSAISQSGVVPSSSSMLSPSFQASSASQQKQ